MKAVAGVDIGGSRKGFHAVVLRDGAFFAQFASKDPWEIAAWCNDLGAQFIGVDAPCEWSAGGGSRPAERELHNLGVHCYFTPTQEKAKAHVKGFYDWVFNGIRLFEVLEATHPLYAGGTPLAPTCFETFPHAAACALAGKVVSAKQKSTIRRALLEAAGLPSSLFSNQDKVDAALCALTAHRFSVGKFRVYGEAGTGLIVVPAE